MREAFISTLLQAAEEDPKVVLLMAEVGFSVVEEFEKRFPNRFYNVGISEQNLVATAAGFALRGLKPVAYSMACFLPSRAFEQIKVDVCYPNLPVVLVGVGTGLSYGNFDATHHAIEDTGIMSVLPNIQVICPSTADDTKHAAIEALNCGSPCYIALSKNIQSNIPILETPYRIGKAIKMRDGKNAAIITVGLMLHTAMKVAETLEEKGIYVSVYNMHTIKPLDKNAIKEAAETGNIFIMDEHTVCGGLTGELTRFLVEEHICLDNFVSFSIPDCFSHKTGSREYLLKQFGLDQENVAVKIMGYLSGLIG